MEKKDLSVEEINEINNSTVAMMYANAAIMYGKKRGTNLTPKKKKRKKQHQ